ncbi:polysaccharide biosynthesis/export family protein [Chitinophaga agrisoli]|uniref:polysaccharide biosynthesis/export family protein n=1 Tax=Chitinophaga agrisoli TaxID=2607653 RepID=UPI001FE5D6AC|nr:polysaccharide biosynthesis/export family protein [Chitinophaga agrisoli]
MLITSCAAPKNTLYLENIRDTTFAVSGNFEPLIQKNDVLQINVSSLNPEDAVIYNASNTVVPGGGGGGTSGSSAALGGFLVDQQGMLQYPVLGPIKAEGLTKKGLTDYIRGQLVDRKLLVDPVVSVRFLNYRVTLLGEVTRPTVVNVTNEKISILEAIGMAGDITVYGKKENVLLIRDQEGQRLIKRLNLNDKNILASPYYYLQSNDIVYVEPNKAKQFTGEKSRVVLPIIFSGLSLLVIILDRLVLR